MSISLLISDASPLWRYTPNPTFFPNIQNTWTGVQDQPSRSISSATTNTNTNTNPNAPAQPPPSTPLTPTYHTPSGPAGIALPGIWLNAFSPIYDKSSTSTAGSYAVTLQVNDGQPQTWDSGQNYTHDFGQSLFKLNVACAQGGSCGTGNEVFKFRGASIQTQVVPSGSTPQEVTIDDTNPVIQYDGFAPLPTTYPGLTVSQGDYQSTLSMTSTANASATMMFKGTSILLKGVTAGSLGPYSITLDDSTTTYSAGGSNVTAHGVVLFFTTALDESKTHTLRLTAMAGDQGATGLVLDQATIWGSQGNTGFIGTVNGQPTTVLPSGAPNVASTGGPAPSNGTTNGVAGNATGGGSSAGVIIGAILGVLAGLTLIYLLFRRLQSKKAPPPKAKTENPWDVANNLQNMKNENVHVTTVANQRYVYPGLIAHSELK